MVFSKKKILIVSSGGGFAWETFELGEKLSKIFELEYVQTSGSEKLAENYPGYRFHFIPVISHRNRLNRIKQISSILEAMGQLFRIVGEAKPNLIVGIGSSSAIPALIVAKFKRVKSIYIESITRTSTLSRTCRLVLRFNLANDVLVQWPNQTKLHPRLRYEGWVL